MNGEEWKRKREGASDTAIEKSAVALFTSSHISLEKQPAAVSSTKKKETKTEKVCHNTTYL